MERLNSHYPVKMAADPAQATRIPYGAVAGACLFAVSGSGEVTWNVAFDAEGELFPLFDTKNQPVKSTLSEGNAVDVPAALFAAPFIVGVGADVEAVISVSS
jgi:hypothetical protein